MRRATMVGAVLGAAVLLGACTSGTAPDDTTEPEISSDAAQVPEGLGQYYGQDLQWSPCGGDFQCAELQVPKDYDDPQGPAGDFGLQVLRSPSTGAAPLGSLVVNPGGPGGSGVDYARAARAIVSPEVADAYDVVGFDPRGVVSSEPVDCLTDSELDVYLNVDPTPDDEQELQDVVGATAAMGQGCAERSPESYAWVDSESVARDMDVLRAVLDQEQLHYLGASYGTLLGATYSRLFPERVGRFVLDGALPPDLSAEDVSRGQAVGFEVALERFVAQCLGSSDCPLTGDVDDGVAQIQQFLAGLDTQPLPALPGRPLTEAWGAFAILYYLYFPPSDWQQLIGGLEQAFAGDGSTLMQMLDSRVGRSPDGTYRDNGQEVFYAVNCLDHEVGEVAEITQRAEDWSAEAPTWGPYLAYSDLVCAQWPVEPVNEPTQASASGTAPILVVSTQYDPATPYEWGPRLVEQLPGSALVSFNADGHTGYRNGSECVDAAVDATLLEGVLPDEDPRCGY